MKKTLLILSIFSLFSVANAQNKSYEPIHNLVPLGYNPLTTNYNPDYDNYSAFNKSNNITPKTTTSLNNDLKMSQLNNQYTNHVNNMVNSGSLADAVKNSILANHDRAQMEMISNSETGGCGSRGGPGYRKANGQCASWND